MENRWAAPIPAAHPSPVSVVRETIRNQVTCRRVDRISREPVGRERAPVGSIRIKPWQPLEAS